MAKKMGKIKKEAQVEKYLTRECLKRGWMCWKLESPNRKGVPDRLILAPYNVTVMVECKKPGGKLSPLQSYTISKLRNMMHILFVVETFDQIDLIIAQIEETMEKRRKKRVAVQS